MATSSWGMRAILNRVVKDGVFVAVISHLRPEGEEASHTKVHGEFDLEKKTASVKSQS